MHTLYYRPEGAWVGDVMPCYHDGTFYMYYQCDHRIPKPFPNGEPFGWSLARSKDMVNFEDFGEVLKKGAKNTHEECLYAGCVIWGNGCFRAFYTGQCEAYKKSEVPGEIIMMATSTDGIHWKKHPELSLMVPTGYEKHFYRDPHVFFNGEFQKWMMVVPCRRDHGPINRRGVMVYLTSDDLEHWTFAGELWAPNMYHMLQMPDLFKIGDWWYMFFSEYCDERKTRYRMAKSIHGPWLAPADDCLDARCFYAARTIAVGDKRYIYGWNPTRTDNSDLGMWIWGGSAVMQEIYQRPDGTLGVKLPEMFDERFIASASKVEDFELSRVDGSDERVIVTDTGTFYRVDMTITFGEGVQSFGIKMYENSQLDLGYAYQFKPGRNTVEFDKLPNMKWFILMNRGMSRPVSLEAGKPYRITVIVDDDLSVVYVNGVAMNARMCEKPGEELKVYVNTGTLKVENIIFYNGLNKD